jgi:hypothetical protein
MFHNMTEHAELRFDTTILCDDIRREDTGKLILIGVYQTNIVASHFPVELSLFVHAEGEVIEAGAVTATFTVEDDSGGVLFRSRDHVRSSTHDFKRGRFAMDFNVMFAVHKTTKFHVIINTADGVKHVITTREVRLGAVPEEPGQGN